MRGRTGWSRHLNRSWLDDIGWYPEVITDRCRGMLHVARVLIDTKNLWNTG